MANISPLTRGCRKANGQSLPSSPGAFFEVEGGLISRVTVYYNLEDWIRQVGGAGDRMTIHVRALTGTEIRGAVGRSGEAEDHGLCGLPLSL